MIARVVSRAYFSQRFTKYIYVVLGTQYERLTTCYRRYFQMDHTGHRLLQEILAANRRCWLITDSSSTKEVMVVVLLARAPLEKVVIWVVV